MTPDEHRAALTTAIAAISATDLGSLTTPVPACGDWTIADVIVHTSTIQRWATRILTTHAQERPARGRGPDLAGQAVIDHFIEGATGLTDALDAADLDEVLYTFIGPRPAAWWLRRQAHETTVHAWDVHPAPIAAATAVDGIDELFEVFVPTLPADHVDGHGETVHLHATDADGEWLIRFDADRLAITPEHSKGDAAARGTASDLLLFAWSRIPPESLTTFGDPALLTRFQSTVTF